MSGIQESVLAAVGDGASTRQALIEQTGLEPNQVDQALHILKKKGDIVKGDDGYAIGDGKTAPVPRVHAATQAGDEERVGGGDASPTKRKPRRVAKPRAQAKSKSRPAKKRRARPGQALVPAAAGGGGVPVQFARFGDYVVLCLQDLVDLAALIHRLDRWRPIAELARPSPKQG